MNVKILIAPTQPKVFEMALKEGLFLGWRPLRPAPDPENDFMPVTEFGRTYWTTTLVQNDYQRGGQCQLTEA